ncbi:MAG: hypothetical protein JKY60_19180 [Kordiimonadaceae bacterium]|nr:hypothetical protein [Kordiimonadaceae bacterium]
MTKETSALDILFETSKEDPVNPKAKAIAGVCGEDESRRFKYDFSTERELLAALDIQSELYESTYRGKKQEFLFRG